MRRVRGLSRISLSYNILPLFSADASIYVSFSPSYFFAITLPRQSSTIKKIRKPPYSSGGALGFHRNGPTMRGRALDCCRNRGRAGTNPGTPERPSETGTAALRTGQAITLYFFPAATFIDHPAVSGTPRTPLQRFSGTAFLFRPFFPAVFIVILITNDYI